MPNLTKICPVVGQSWHMRSYGRTEGHAEANGRLWRLCEKRPLAFSLCEIWGSRNGINVDSRLLLCYTVTISDRRNTQDLFTFHRIVGYYLRVQKASTDTKDIFSSNQGRTRNLWQQSREQTWLQHPTIHGLSNTGKAIPLQAWTSPEASRRFRLPDFNTIGTWRW